MAIGATVVSAKRVIRKPPVPVVAAVIPIIPPGPTPEELAEQAAQQQAELTRKQVREQMGQYRYLGYLNQQGVHKAFVGKGNDIYIIRKGDKLDGKFLVASIDPTSVKLTEPTTNLETLLDLIKEGEPGTS
jgi:hypothetical protein